MIKNDFYAADPNFSAVSAELTLPFNDLALTDRTKDPVHAYYMGAITGNSARLYTGKSVTLSGSSLTADKFTISDNGGSVNWGIMHSPPRSPAENIIYYNGTQWYSATTSYRLINKLNAFSCRVPGGLSLQFAVKPKETVTLNGRDVVYCMYRMLIDTVTKSLTAKEFTDFMENGATISIQTGIAIKWEDAINGRYWEVDYNDTTYLVALIGCTIANWYSYYTPDTNVDAKPFVGIKIGDDLVIQPDCETGYQYNTTNEIWVNGDWTAFKLRSFYYNDYTHSVTTSEYLPGDTGIYFPVVGDIPLDIMDWNSRQGGNKPFAFNDDMSCFVQYSTYTTIDGVRYYRYDIYAVLSPIDIYKALFCAFWRDSATGSTSANALYETGDLITIYDNANNPLKKEPFTTYTEIESKLRPWQKYGHDISENDYDPDNPPSPDPGGDTPGDEPQDLPHDDGDPPDLQKNRTIGVPAMFITQYALTSAELETVGANLWQSWLTPNTDVHLNFFLPYAQDFGTLNIGAALDFIVSLKVFPFEFTIDYYTPANGVRMGTGHTDFLGDSAPVIHSQIICIDAGTLKVELPNPYNDFRDMFNCSALCFMPYCGTVELNLQEILGRTLKASYFIDLQSGGCTCVIECEGDEGDYVIASKTGQIGFTLPMTATNAGQLAAQAMSDATKAIGTLSGFFFDSAKTIGNNLTSAITAQLGKKTGVSEKGEVSLLSGNTFETSTKLGQSSVNTGLSLANQVIDMLSRSAVEMPMLSGGGSAEAFMFADCVSIQIRRGKYKKPDNYPHSVGHYNLSSRPISEYRGAFTGSPATGSDTGKGLCMFAGIDTSGLDCRDDERAEIISLLESGVYL